jgi:hypothetical protein
MGFRWKIRLQDEERTGRMSRDKTRRDQFDEYDEYWEADDDDLLQDDFHVPTARPARSSRSRRSYAPPRDERRPRRRSRRRRVWPWLLVGCAGGIVMLVLAAAIVVLLAIHSATGGNISGLPGIPGLPKSANYTRQSTQTLSVSSLGLLQVQDPIGNVTITVDPNATSATLTTIKHVKVASSSAAQGEFSKIAVQVQPIGSGLSINATVPDSGGILGTHNDSVDLELVLPQSAIATGSTPPAFSVSMSIGNITLKNAGGLLTLKDDVGNITVNQGVLYDGSHLETGTGNVAYSGNINTAPATGNAAPLYKLQSETGNVNAALPASTNVILDANTNLGKINSEFPINVTNSDGAANYYGPLLANSTPAPTAILTLDVSTGNVTIQEV